jgi:hypothetical protein
MPVSKQASFTGGEISPSLQFRTDLEKYYTSLAEAYNVFVHAHGGVSNVAGTKFVGEVYDSDYASRLVPFQYNTTQTYILEFSHNKMRVIKDGGLVLTTGDVIYSVTSPYPSTALSLLKFVQSADVLYITHESYPVYRLTRADHDDWTFAAVSFTPTQASPTSVTVTNDFGAGTYTRRYRVTAVSSEGEESIYATGTGASQAADTAWTEGKTVTVAWTAADGAASYNVYKETANGNGIYGFVGRAASTSFIDTKIEPDSFDSPPEWTNPFGSSGNYPIASTFFEQRQVFGGTTNKKDTFHLSVTGGFNNFSKSSPQKADDAIEATIPARQVNEIRHFVPMNDLLIFTSGSEFKLTSGDNALAFDTARLKPQSYYGCSHVAPIVIGYNVLFIQARGSLIRSLSYSLERDGYIGEDLTVFAEHFFRDKEILDWTYAQIPHSIIYCIRDDGKLLMLTYMPEHQVFGWSLGETDGVYESVASVPEGAEDAVYFVVKRYIDGAYVRHIERLQTRYFTDIRDAFFVHDGLSLDNPITITGATSADPVVITATAHGLSDGDNVDISDVVGMTELNNGRYTVANKTDNTFELDGIDGTEFASYISGGYVRKAVNTVSGLDHLEGKTVVCLCDGNVVQDLVVASGAVTFDRKFSRIHVGLPYTSRIKTLAIDYSNGALNGKERRVPDVYVQVENSRGLKIGASDLQLLEMKDREFEAYDEPTAMFTGTKKQATSTKWDRKGQVVVQQDYPLPMTIAAILPEADIGG